MAPIKKDISLDFYKSLRTTYSPIDFEKKYSPFINIFLFFIFALYGPSFNIYGEFRYIEVVVLIIALFNIVNMRKYVDKITKLFVFLFFITAISQIFSDSVNDALTENTVKRVGTYVVFIFILLGCKFIARGDWRTLRWMLLGYCLSWVFIYFVGTNAALDYHLAPWRLGMGWAFTLAVCLCMSFFSKLKFTMLLILIPVSLIHIGLNSRSVALFTFFTFLISVYSWRFGKYAPEAVTIKRFLTITGGLLLGLVATYYLIILATDKNLFPPEMQVRTEAQVYSEYGLVATARPETAAAVVAIAERPIIGWGSTAYDPLIWRYYIDLLTANWRSRTNFESIYRNTFAANAEGGLPSHSHYLGAWVDGGFFASLGWLSVMVVSLISIIQCSAWRHPIVPAILFISSTTIWDVLFSPGPHRMDMALRLTFLTFILTYVANIQASGPKKLVEGT